jgi:hypothetical protein
MDEMKKMLSAFKTFKPRGVALWGSYGLGLNDQFTHDVDIVIYVNQLPLQSVKKKVFAALSDVSIQTVAFPYKEADFFVYRYKFYEITFKLCSDMEAEVERLRDGESQTESNVAMFLHYTKPIFDDGWMIAQKERVKRYPDRLMESNLFLHLFLALRNVHYYERAINKRKQPLWAEFCINEGLESLVKAVFAANKTYYAKKKWAEIQLRKLKNKPDNFDQKLIAIMHSRNFREYKQFVSDVCSFYVHLYPHICADITKIDAKLTRIDEIIESNNAKSIRKQ